jgi:hypothetical protein
MGVRAERPPALPDNSRDSRFCDSQNKMRGTERCSRAAKLTNRENGGRSNRRRSDFEIRKFVLDADNFFM